MFKVGQHVWTIDPIYLKQNGHILAYMMSERVVLSADFDMAATLDTRHTDLEHNKGVSVLDLFSVRFVKIDQCYTSYESACTQKSALEKMIGSQGTEPSPIGETGAKSDREDRKTESVEGDRNGE